MRISLLFRAVLVLISTAMLLATVSLSQTIVTGGISGIVTDPSGAAIAGATVTLNNAFTGVTQTATTGSDGGYGFALLKPGTYAVTVEQSGFSKAIQSVDVLLGRTTTANIKLQLGSATTTVEVTGAAPVLQTEDANITTNFDTQQVQNIPNPGNDITYVAQTAPGVTMNNSTAGGYGNFSAFGLPATANLFTINGNDYNDPFLNLNNSGASNLLLGNNDIQEVAVVSNAYTGQYGRQAGAQGDYTTMSGTNSFHGNLIYDWTGRELNANDPLNKLAGGTRPFENNNQWAASIGGPIVKNKLFFFADEEGIRYIFGSINTTFSPTPAFESYVLGNIPQDPKTQAFYQNIFKLYNAAPGIAAASPVANSCASVTAFTGDCLQSWTTSLSNGNQEWLLITRLDYDIDPNNKLFGRFKLDRGVQPTYTDPINATFDDTSNQPQYEGQLNYTHVFSPTVVNNFIGSVLWYAALFGSQDPPKALGLFPGNLYVYDSSLTALGTGSGNPNGFVADFFYPSGRAVTQWGLVDDLSVTRGSHEFKMGVNFRRDDVSDHTASQFTQYPIIETSLLGFSEDEITPPAAVTAGVPGTVFSNFAKSPVQPIAMYSFGLYFQDEYRVSSRLKLTLALRAERNSGGACQHACAAVPLTAFTDLPHGADIPYDVSFGSGRTNITNVEKAVFEPRFGFAWTPFGQSTVLRGGVGMFSDLYAGVILDTFTTNFPQVNVWSIDPGTATVAFDQGSPTTTAFPNSGPVFVDNCNTAFTSNYASGGNLATYQAAAPLCASTVPNYNSPPAKLLNPKYVEWNFEIQQSLGTRTVFSINYVGNIGYDELLQDPYANAFCDANCTAAGLTNTGLPTAPPDPRVGSVLQLTNAGYSNYNGLVLSLQENGWHGLSGRVNYTYSHALDVESNGGTSFTPFSVITSLNYQVNPFSPSAGYGPADYDARHVVSANYIYELPFKSGNRLLNTAIGGWQVSGTWFYHTGFPFSVFDGQTVDSLIASNNLNNATILLQPTFSQRNFPNGGECAMAPCFALEGTGAAPGTPLFATATNFTGAVGRNAFRGPGFLGGDFSIRKNFNVTERVGFQIGLNVYNVLNHANFGAPWPNTARALQRGNS